MRKRTELDHLEAANAAVLADIVVDPETSDALRVSILNKLLEFSEGQSFFSTIYNEKLSYGACPSCNHKNHWLVPEEDLAQMGFITHEEDPRVSRTTDKESCPTWQESCKKKKVNI